MKKKRDTEGEESASEKKNGCMQEKECKSWQLVNSLSFCFLKDVYYWHKGKD